MTLSRQSHIVASGKPNPGSNSAVRGWLVIIALLVALTAVIGAATRLTGSGLSITEWAPIMGLVPPLTEAQWLEAFEKYKAIPQYTRVNRGMSLDAFRSIYWWEWGHRVIGRVIGVAFLVPFVVLCLRGHIPRSLAPRLILLFLLGGLQGAVGWYMVRSGLVDRVDVSPYRLALHLGLAVAIFALIVWTVLELAVDQHRRDIDTLTATDRRLAHLLPVLIYLQVLLGALVAGLKAGVTYNTWPLMDGALVPNGLLAQTPWWVNLFENVGLVQFNHRLLAYVIAGMACVHAIGVGRRADDARVRRSAGYLATAVLAQGALGIWTLLAWVPLGLGIAHQAGALVVTAVAIWHLFNVRRASSE